MGLHTSFSRLAVGAVLATSSAALAEEPPHCWWDATTQKLTKPYADDTLPAWSAPSGNRFAYIVAGDDEQVWGILYHCPTDNYLVYRASTNKWDKVSEQFQSLIEADAPYTLRQIGDDLAILGAEARLGQGDLGRCACDHLQSINALK